MHTPSTLHSHLAKRAYLLLHGRLRWLIWTFGVMVAFPAVIAFAE